MMMVPSCPDHAYISQTAIPTILLRAQRKSREPRGETPGRTGGAAGVVRVLHRAEVGAVPVAGGLADALAGAQPCGDGVVAILVANR